MIYGAGGGDQHFGFSLNRTTDVTLAKLSPQHAPLAKVANLAYLGGAEMPQALFALTARDPGKPSMRLFGSLYLTADEVTIDRIIDRTPNEASFFAGFVVAAARARRRDRGGLLVRRRGRRVARVPCRHFLALRGAGRPPRRRTARAARAPRCGLSSGSAG